MTYGKFNVDWQQRVDFDRLRQDRIDKANAQLHKFGVGAAIVYSWDTSRYLGSPWCHPYGRHLPRRFALLIRDAGFPYVTVGDNDGWWPRHEAPWLEGRICTDDTLYQPTTINIIDEVAGLEDCKKTVQQIQGLMKKHGVEGLPVSIDWSGVFLPQALREAGITVVNGNTWALEASMVKTEDEVELMKMAATCNEAGYGALVKEFRVGMRENEVQSIMGKAIYNAGAEYIEGWVVDSGPRAAPRAYNWSDRTVRPGEFMSVEACHVTYCGYKVCYDRTFFVGDKPNETQKEIYACTADLHHKIKNTLKPGLTNREIINLRPFLSGPLKSLKEVKEYRTKFNNHLGGMGIRWNDSPHPRLDDPDRTLEKNMILAYHSVYLLEGVAGVAIENTYRITDDGCECLNLWPWEELMVLG
ncbi:M24 family metallopeptidase [Chloroflexota bacterium]